eukprot:8057039-Karenia_brevis.AAC.1
MEVKVDCISGTAARLKVIELRVVPSIIGKSPDKADTAEDSQLEMSSDDGSDGAPSVVSDLESEAALDEQDDKSVASADSDGANEEGEEQNEDRAPPGTFIVWNN